VFSLDAPHMGGASPLPVARVRGRVFVSQRPSRRTRDRAPHPAERLPLDDGPSARRRSARSDSCDGHVPSARFRSPKPRLDARPVPLRMETAGESSDPMARPPCGGVCPPILQQRTIPHRQRGPRHRAGPPRKDDRRPRGAGARTLAHVPGYFARPGRRGVAPGPRIPPRAEFALGPDGQAARPYARRRGGPSRRVHGPPILEPPRGHVLGRAPVRPRAGARRAGGVGGTARGPSIPAPPKLRSGRGCSSSR